VDWKKERNKKMPKGGLLREEIGEKEGKSASTYIDEHWRD